MTRILRQAGFALIGATALLAWPGTAGASNSVVNDGGGGGFVDVSPAAGFGDSERHQIHASYNSVTMLYTVTDTAGVTPAGTCLMVNGTTATCPSAGVTEVILSGGAANDVLTVASVGPQVAAAVPSGTGGVGLHGFGGNDTQNGSPVRDFNVGYDGQDRLFGNAGGDRMLGGPGRDNGNDFLDGGLGPDIINGDGSEGGNSIDTLSYAGRNEQTKVTLGPGVFDDGGPSDFGTYYDSAGGANVGRDLVLFVENVIGGNQRDVIIAPGKSPFVDEENDNANNRLIGLNGPDKLVGGYGPDKLLGGKAADKLVGGSKKDLCNGGPGRDRAKTCEKLRKI